jgi:ATP-dependent HslUV protease ATP-binding subunit HslU
VPSAPWPDSRGEPTNRQKTSGRRRLHTILEKLLEEISFEAPEQDGQRIVIDEKVVEEKLAGIMRIRS